ncbi:MAG: phosphatidate cytidylyltransferase [Chitinophagaceae bacterium]|nr:phosphatidate cytidylyltransferase [Chitinophagaceae bacterium]
MNLTTEQSRKFLHVAGGFMCLLFPGCFTSHWWVLGLTAVAFIILLITYKRKLLPQVHETKRSSVGSVLFPIPIYACFLIAELQQDDLFFYLPVSLLAISDTAAETGGALWGDRSIKFFNGQKTLAGSFCFLVTAILVSIGWLYIGFHLPLADAILAGLAISIAATIAELLTLHGWDNLSIPAVTILLLQLMI